MPNQEDAARRLDLASATLRPRSIAIVGASDSVHKVGGRPIAYLQRFGYRGRIYAINPHRPTVQGLATFSDVAALPEAPDLAVVATPPADVLPAVEACAKRGTSAVIVLTSGFGEAPGGRGRDAERAMIECARAAGMRLVGPNSQGIANFHLGAVASFSTQFLDPVPKDGPVAVVSQSGIMSALPLALLQRAGIGTRYSVATGNEADVTTGEMALAVLEDPEIELLLLYLESIRDPEALARAAALARERGVPIVAVKAGRSALGQMAAGSHTGALAAEDRVVDAFLRHHRIYRVRDIHELVRAAPLYLRHWRPEGGRLVVVSNSGASGVMAADTADDLGLPLATFDPAAAETLAEVLPPFATPANPLDLTAGLMTDSGLLGRVLTTLADQAADLFCIDLPMTGEGYDVDTIVSDTARFAAAVGRPVVAVTPQPAAAAKFQTAGLPTFDNQTEALEALAGLVDHVRLMRRPPPSPVVRSLAPPSLDGGRWLHEAESLALLGALGLPVVRHRLCLTIDEARTAFRDLGPMVVVKACSRDVPHKGRHGLVALGVATEDDTARAGEALSARLAAMGARDDGILVAAMAGGPLEMVLGVTRDPIFGPIVVIGAGGLEVEDVDDAVVLVPPFAAADVRDALARLNSGRLLDAGGGARTLDAAALCDAAVRAGEIALGMADTVRAIDMNPVIVGVEGAGVVIVDALIELASATVPRETT